MAQQDITDAGAQTVTFPAPGLSAFGEASVSQATPIVQVTFPYSVNTALVDVRQNASGTVTHASRSALLSTGAAINSSAEIRSKRVVKYNPGEGVEVRFTAVFTAGVAGATQVIGAGNESDGFFFGYNGTSFGILHRRNGSPEIRTLTVTTGSSHGESITITLDGNAAAVTVTNTANTTKTANEIAAHDYSSVGTGWTARAIGAKVEFVSWDGAAHTGTYSLSGATSAVGSFAQDVAGAAPSDTWIPQASWNGDRFAGGGPSGVTLDQTKGNVYQIKYQWLGYGQVSFFIESPNDGLLHLVHAVKYANANTAPSIGDPSLCFSAKVANTTNATAVTLATPSIAMFVEGEEPLLGVRRGIHNTKTTVTTAYLPIVSVRLGQHYSAKAIRTFAKILRVAVSAEHTKPIAIAAIENGTLVGAVWASVDSNVSALQYDTTATAVTGGAEIFAVPLGKGGNAILSFADDHWAGILDPGRVITFAAIANSGTGGEATVAVTMLERL